MRTCVGCIKAGVHYGNRCKKLGDDEDENENDDDDNAIVMVVKQTKV